ncbi:sushi, von Willebrand factor type A, EGF and pentraxin domain-containing protein 1-like [Mytilus edulis]|uniref:sushi, von Willebrand factor type A, EGF and pentraxin domain-containing protein 1-like n=1 Tax=Mytilus edulis TaxID=6550 RepID=UPI0039EFAC00
MALTVKVKKLIAKYRKDEDDDNSYVNTEFTIKDASCHENDQSYYDQLDPGTNHQKAKPNEYSQWEDRQISTDEIYENNEQSGSGILQQKEVIHLESKLPIPKSSKGLNIRHYKIGIGILAVICFILVVTLIAVAVGLSARSKCEGLGCLNNGICTLVDGYMKCECLEGFNGPRCEVTPCSSNPCHHTGECTFGLNSSDYICSCPSGFTGSNCQVTPCSSNPCQHNGVCAYNVNSTEHNCTCKRGFSGSNCQVTPCSSTPCMNNGLCKVEGHGYICKCLDSFTGPQCTDYKCDVENIDEASCVLEQDVLNDDFDWTRRTGGTPTPGTGPSFAAEGSYYFYMEADNGQYGWSARLISRNLKKGFSKCLSFNYYMYGSTIGYLRVMQDRLAIWKNSTSINSWQFQSFNISSAASRIVFQAYRGSGVSSDIAIDNITITAGAC